MTDPAPRVLLVEPDAERRAALRQAVIAARGSDDGVLIVPDLEHAAADLDELVAESGAPLLPSPFPDLEDLPPVTNRATCKHSTTTTDRKGRRACASCGVRTVQLLADPDTGQPFGRGGLTLRKRTGPKLTKADRKAAKRAKRDARRAGGVRPVGSTLDDLEDPDQVHAFADAELARTEDPTA